jgi:hypothetical protein
VERLSFRVVIIVPFGALIDARLAPRKPRAASFPMNLGVPIDRFKTHRVRMTRSHPVQRFAQRN